MAHDIPNLHCRKNAKGVAYYRYLMPSGEYESLGKDHEAAVIAATALNDKRESEVKAQGLPVGAGGKTMMQLIELYEPVKLRTTKSAATEKEWRRKFKRYREWMGDWKVAKVTVLHLDQLLEEKAPQYDPYRLHRLLVSELFTYGLGKGWRRQINGNPGKALLPPKLAREKGQKMRKRMTLEIFKAIRKEAPDWLKVAMDLALQIGIRRGDICELKLESFKDGHLFFIPSKTVDLPTPAAIKIPLTRELKDIEAAARDLPPLSPCFLHRQNSFHRAGEATARKYRSEVLPEQLSRHFAIARDAAVLARPDLFKGLKPNELQTFHEIRSLCAKLYQRQGRSVEQVQLLLGHADIGMTEVYQEGYGVEWQEAVAGLNVTYL